MRTPTLSLLCVLSTMALACDDKGGAPPASSSGASGNHVKAPSSTPAGKESGAPHSSASAAGDHGGGAGAQAFTTKAYALPGAKGAVSMDYLAVDRAKGAVIVPAGDTGSVDVIEVATGKVTRIEGFPTKEVEREGKKRQMGPSSATVGEGFDYVGNRANSEICAIDSAKLTKGACVTLPSSPDGIQYVGSSKELWATTPKDKSITIFDASTPGTLKAKGKIALDGAPEGYAVDHGQGVFFTNLEDKDKTLVIDVKSRKVKSTWDSKCGEKGPRGLALDAWKKWVFVACTDHVEVLDLGNNGAALSKLDTGAGVDNIDYLSAKKLLYVVAGKEGKLTVAKSTTRARSRLDKTGTTAPGTRVVVADGQGTAYVADSAGGQVLALTPAQ